MIRVSSEGREFLEKLRGRMEAMLDAPFPSWESFLRSMIQEGALSVALAWLQVEKAEAGEATVLKGALWDNLRARVFQTALQTPLKLDLPPELEEIQGLLASQE